MSFKTTSHRVSQGIILESCQGTSAQEPRALPVGLVREGLEAVKGRGRDTEWETTSEQVKGGRGCRP